MMSESHYPSHLPEGERKDQHNETHVDLCSGGGEDPTNMGGKTQRFLGIQFACCGVYQRIYINSTETAYEGRCPKCCRPVRIRVGAGGTDHRFFTAY
jgi:hypothetical protein